MRKFRGVLKGGMYCGLALAMMLSCASCGKEEVKVDDYVIETDDEASGSVTNNTESDTDVEADTETASESDNVTSGGNLRDIYGDTITANDSFSIDGVNANFKLKYTVPDASLINVYEGAFVEENADIEKTIVTNFFGGTEKNLEEIKYVNDSDYILLLYKYRNILMYHSLGGLSIDTSSEDYRRLTSNIDSSFEDVYTWVDENAYYIHMYEGEYSGNRYGMIYSYDKAKSTRNIFISPISISEYFPDIDAKTLFVVDPQYSDESENLCNMSEEDIKNDAGDIIERLGLSNDDVVLTFAPEMAVPEASLFTVYGNGETLTEMPKLVFSDSDMTNSVHKMNQVNPTGMTYSYRFLKEQQSAQGVQSNSGDASFTENGYAVYLCSKPFAENVAPQSVSTFNRGSVLYTDKGLFLVDLSEITEIDNVVADVQLLSFDNIKESFKEALENDPEIMQKSSGSLEVDSVSFTYVLVNDKEDNNKASYVPAWYFQTTDKKLKNGEQHVTYSHVINAIDGSDLKDTIR